MTDNLYKLKGGTKLPITSQRKIKEDDQKVEDDKLTKLTERVDEIEAKIPNVAEVVKTLKIGGKNQLELRDIKGARLDMRDQRWHGGGGNTAVVALSDVATPSLDASTGIEFTLIATGDRTIAVPSSPTNGQKITIRHFASGGARTLALNTGTGGFRFGTDLTSLSQTASGKTDYIGAIYNLTDNKWDVVAYIKGY